MQLYSASRQWCARPEDERFASVESLLAAVRAVDRQTVEHRLRGRFAFAYDEGEIVQHLGRAAPRTVQPMRFSHWAFSQACSRLGAPADFIRTLSLETACNALNECVERMEEPPARVLAYQNGQHVARAVYGSRYARLRDSRVAQITGDLMVENDWDLVPPDHTKARGLYYGDRSLFMFLIAPKYPIEAGKGDTLYRGAFVENSEVGARSFKLTTFLYRTICANHIVWGANKVQQVRFRHTGDIDAKAIGQLRAQLRSWANADTSHESAIIKNAQAKRFRDRDEFVEYFAPRLSLRAAQAAWEDLRTTGDQPNLWNVVQSLTRRSQQLKWADARANADVDAGALLKGVA